MALRSISAKKAAQLAAEGQPPRSPLAKIGKKRAAQNAADGITQYNTIRDRVGTERGEFNRPARPAVDPRKAPFNKKIRERDKACLLCGGHGDEVHHLFTVGAHPELEFVEANVILVCRFCHRLDKDAIHPNNVTVCRAWRAKEYEPFGAMYDFEGDRPLFWVTQKYSKSPSSSEVLVGTDGAACVTGREG